MSLEQQSTYGRFIDPDIFLLLGRYGGIRLAYYGVGELPEFSGVQLEHHDKPVSWLPNGIESVRNAGPSIFDLPLSDDGLALQFLMIVFNGEADPLPSNIVSALISSEVGDIEPFRGVLSSSFWWLNSTKAHPNLAYLYTTE